MAEKGGQPGNLNAHKGKVWHQALKRALSRYGNGNYEAGLDKLADRLVKAAGEGDESAAHIIIERIADRFDGKPTQMTEVSGPDGGPIQVSAVQLVNL